MLFETDEMALATTLQTCGYKCQGTRWEEKGRKRTCYFQFEVDEAAEVIIKFYWLGDCQVEPKVFANTFGRLRSLMFESDQLSGR
jgi:hypothetical protein